MKSAILMVRMIKFQMKHDFYSYWIDMVGEGGVGWPPFFQTHLDRTFSGLEDFSVYTIQIYTLAMYIIITKTLRLIIFKLLRK